MVGEDSLSLWGSGPALRWGYVRLVSLSVGAVGVWRGCKIWFPATPNQLASLVRKRYHNPVRVFSDEFLGSTVSSFKGMRGELVRMGFGPFEDWEFITSGMHAVRPHSFSLFHLSVSAPLRCSSHASVLKVAAPGLCCRSSPSCSRATRSICLVSPQT
jgi:hypothetical protein